MSVFRNLLMQQTGWTGKPADWSDIRKGCPANSIALYAAHTDDYSSYDNLGFTATCTGGYNVYIDGTQFGSTYASGAQCNITWSTSGITTGDDITTPSALKAHKIWIEPATEGNNITAFHCARVAASGQEQQGVLWAHFNISNTINVSSCFNSYNVYRNTIMEAITAKNNIIKISSSNLFLFGAWSLSYAPILDLDNGTLAADSFSESDYKLESLVLQNGTITSFNRVCFNCYSLEKLKIKNITINVTNVSYSFSNCYALKDNSFLDSINWTNVTNATDFIVNAVALKDTVLDVRAATGLTKIGCYGTSTYFMSGFKGLRVSNEAPFNHATAPQINVSYTGMDRQALVTLFNDLPTVSDGQIINITGCTGSQQLSDDEIAIAENKGWTVTGGPAYQVYATYNASVGDTIKLNDGMATSNMAWSAYPSDTAITGSYTQTATVTAVEENNIIECQKPIQDNKDVTVNAGEIYYAYTNENDSDDSVYTVDNPVLISSTLYDNTFTSLDPQPEFTVNEASLINATEIGTLTNNNGVYSGFSSSNYIQLGISLTSSDTYKFITSITTTGSLNRDDILSNYSPYYFYIRKGYLGFYDGNSKNAGTTPLQTNTKYWVGFEWTGSNTITYFAINDDTYTKETLPPFSDTSFWTLNSTFSSNLLSGQTIYLGVSNNGYVTGSLDINNTMFIINDTIINFYNPNASITINNTEYIKTTDNDLIKPITATIEILDNTTIQTVTITSDQTAEIETSTSVTTDNNGVVITDGSRHNFNITVPSSFVSIMQNGGQQYDVTYCPYTFKANTGVGLLLKNGNDVYYRNSWIMNRDYDLHYQQINFSYPSGATVTCKVNNVLQTDLTPYCYAGDTITWTCDNAGTVTTGSYTVKYSSKDGNIQTITIS